MNQAKHDKHIAAETVGKELRAHKGKWVTVKEHRVTEFEDSLSALLEKIGEDDSTIFKVPISNISIYTTL